MKWAGLEWAGLIPELTSCVGVAPAGGCGLGVVLKSGEKFCMCCVVLLLLLSGIINRGTDMETGEANVKLFTKYNLLKLWTVCVMFFVNFVKLHGQIHHCW